MQCRLAFIGVLLLVSVLANADAGGQTDRPPQRTAGGGASARPPGPDLYLKTGVLLSHTLGSGQSLLLCREGFSMTVGNREFTADRGMVWVVAKPASAADGTVPLAQVQVYLGGRVSDQRLENGPETDLVERVLEQGTAVLIQAEIRGEIFITADRKEAGDPRNLPLYEEAAGAFKQAGAPLPSSAERPAPAAPAKIRKAEPNEPAAGYAVSISPLTDVVPKYERTVSPEGREITTYIGRTHVAWQQLGEEGDQADPIEVEADCLVLWRAMKTAEQPGEGVTAVQQGGVTAIYVSGDVLLTQGYRTIRADELFYDLQEKRALARNVVMRTFDATRNIPIYIRAKEFRQVAEDTFEAEDVVLAASEFWTPQFSLEATRIRIIDKRPEGQQGGMPVATDLDVELKDVGFKVGNTTVLGVPKMRTDGGKPELPIRSIRMGHSKTYGASVETRWWLSRLLGLRESEGTDGSVSVDYYGDRGVGGGVDLTYERENYFGSILGYVLDDHGEDRLSRTRKDIEVPLETRGRFLFQHRHYLPYSWQLTAEAGYLSDENFLEQFYRTEFNVGKEQETLLHLKRIQDNWGLSFLGKTRINDFVDQVEELPTAEYHLMGQSLFDDRLTFFSDNQVSRYRYRFDPDNPSDEPDEYFTFTGTRNELDLPLTVGPSKIVPFVAGTFGYEDGAGFEAELNDGTIESEDAIAIGEAGVRMSLQPFWCVYPGVESRLWDLHQLRHVIRPSLTAVTYAESDAVARQRDTLDLGISQRLQTQRGPVGRQRTVDWLELNVDFVWVADSSDEIAGPDRFLWNEPFIPLVNRDGRRIPPLDRRTTDLFGPRQNYISTEMVLRLTDATSLLADLYYDMPNGVVEQLDIGFSRLCWPNLTYYVGSRYLREVDNTLGQQGSTALTFATTYVLDPRYTVVFAEQFDFDYGENIRTDLTLIRKYHRMNLALTFSADESLDEERITLSLWPEGIPELAIGLRRYMELGASDVYH